MITKSFHKKNPTSRLNNSDFFSQWSGWRGSNPQQSAWKAGTLANWVTPASPLLLFDYTFSFSLFKRILIWAWLGSNQRPIGYEPTALTTELHTHLWLVAFSIIINYTKKSSQSFLFFLHVKLLYHTCNMLRWWNW